MKIIIMNDLLILGGAEMQGRREKELLESKDHQVYLLTFDENFPKNHKIYNDKNKFYNIALKDSGFAKVYRKLFSDYFLIKQIKKVIKEIDPDIIHVNNFNIAPYSQYKALEGYKAIQTIRDYSAVCPLDTCIYPNYLVCKGSKFSKCSKECSLNIIDKIKLIRFRKIEKLRKKFINRFISPSEVLTEYCKKHDFKIQCINNSFDFKKIADFKKNINFNEKKYLYFGAVNEIKGVFRLLDAFNYFSQNKKVELIIAGKVGEECRDKFQYYLNTNEKINYIGYQDYEKILIILQEVYSVVVPSLWMENYPNTVLEGMATECLVIGSGRGGIPGMLADNRGILFDILSKEDIIKKLEQSYNFSEKKYYEIINKAKEYVVRNNSIEKYYERLIKIFLSVESDEIE